MLQNGTVNHKSERKYGIADSAFFNYRITNVGRNVAMICNLHSELP
jgi:hypothetical protein